MVPLSGKASFLRVLSGWLTFVSPGLDDKAVENKVTELVNASI
jgi:hypothetical protein